MQTNESQVEKHARLAHQMLDQAKGEAAAGDLTQGAEKFWGATTQALKSYCASHGMPHGRYQHLRQAVLDLALRQDNPSIRLAFNTARACHSNFYNDWMEQEDLDSYIPDIEELVRIILDARAQ
ncbi:MAG: hypothetical protein J4F46_07380 [Dehalococcoidia bacterium]|nr:hypothetical protein [Dehalococcoidia bacterium]